MTYYVYVPIAGENKISTFTLNQETGQLTFQRDVVVGGAPGPLAIDPESKFLYAGLRSTQRNRKLQHRSKHRRPVTHRVGLA